MSCLNEIDICITRGTPFTQTVLLREGFDEVAEEPLSYRGRLAFRYDQNDALPDFLSRAVVPEVTDDGIVLDFELAGSLTRGMPPFDVVAYCELTRADGTSVARLYNAKVEVHD